MFNLKDFVANFIITSLLLILTFDFHDALYVPGKCMPCAVLSDNVKNAMRNYNSTVVTAQEVGSPCCAFLSNGTFYFSPRLVSASVPFNAMITHPLCDRPLLWTLHRRFIFTANNLTIEVDGSADYEIAFAIFDNFTCN